MSDQSKIVAILGGGVRDDVLTQSIAMEGLPAMRFGSLESLSHSNCLASLSVFVFRVGRERLGALLIALSRLSVDYPNVRKIAVVEDGLSIILAAYLSACSVDLLNTGLEAGGVDEVAGAVRRIIEQGSWCVTRIGP